MPPPPETALPAANRIFVDRDEPQRIFENAVFAIPADRAIIHIFYGVGGQGKTALCHELMRKTDVSVEPSYSFLRRALLDLHGREKSDPDLLLVWIRNAFADAGLVLPCFDLALALMWEGARGEQPFPKLTKPWLARSTKVAEGAVDEGASEIKKLLGSETATELLGEAIGEIPGVGFALKRIGNWAIDKTKRAYLKRTREQLRRLYYQEGDKRGELKPPYELSALLPWMLAQDLNYHLAQNPKDRFVLFIDEYERVFEQGGAGARWKENPFDNHMRALIQETNGLLALFFSRERLPWGDHPDWRDDLEGRQHLLGGLAVKDADDFLKAVPIGDEAIREAIIDGARERPDKTAAVYPLMLDLQVEHWRVLQSKGEAAPDRFTIAADTFEARCIELVQRVLRDYGEPLQTTLERLSVARRFDRAAFEHVVKTFGTALPLDSFDRLAGLSFVTRTDDGFLSLHNVVAEAIRELPSEEIRKTSLAALFEHFSSRAKASSHLEIIKANITALFEAAYLRQAQGLDGYAAWLSEATTPARMAAQYAPLTVLWRDASLAIEKALGAEHPDTAASLNNLALLLKIQGDYAGARPFYARALEIHEKALGAEHPDTAQSLNNLAALLSDQGNYAGARPLYARALAIREKALGAEHPDTAQSLNNLAALLHSQGDFAGARPLYARALKIYEKALGAEHPDTARSLNNLAALLSDQGDYAGVRALYERALKIYEKALGAAHPDTVETRKLASLIPVELKKSDKPQSFIAQGKVGRNQPCPCGSGKKYKRCHGSVR
jgi:Tfp pilus assembly protein PilF